MRPEELTTRKVERIVHRTRRVIVWNIQGSEVVKIILDFRTRTNTETGVLEDLLYAHHRARDRVVSTDRRTPSRKRYIDSIRRELCLHGRSLERIASRIQACLNILFRLVDFLTRSRTFLRRQLAEGFQTCGDLAFLAEIGNPNRIKSGKVIGCINLGRSLRDEVAQGGHCSEIEPAGISPGRFT